MGASEGVAAIDEETVVADVGGGQLEGESAGELMSEADIGGDMRGKVGGAVAIYEAGAVAVGEGRPRLGCPALGAEGERIALIRIDEEERVVGGGEVGGGLTGPVVETASATRTSTPGIGFPTEPGRESGRALRIRECGRRLW